MAEQEIVDKIYEAAFAPEGWNPVLDGMAQMTGAASGVLFCFPSLTAPPRYRASEVLMPQVQRFVSGGFWRESVRTLVAFRDPFADFRLTRHGVPVEDLEDDITTQMLAEVGLGEEASTHVLLPTGEVVVIGVQKKLGDAPHNGEEIARLNALLPHLSRATLVAARLGLEIARSTVATLNALGLPAAIASSSGRVLASNALFDGMSETFLPVAFGGLAIADAQANALLQNVFRSTLTSDASLTQSIPVRAVGGRDPLVVHIIPIRRSARDIISGADLLIVATAIRAQGVAPSIAVLTALFDLTPAQARTAAALAEGASVGQIAANFQITEKTVRTYVERIFVKTGTQRLSQLLQLLRSAQPLI
ncbi:MAG: LuxR C-terminal-related transcriptional regulator [Proteobacteria bacterium]|nr:LuxR C-terminal-related transcriptional regulator [Pseudomonadota bacterium]